MDKWYDIQRRKAENEMYNEFSKMGAEVECSYCGEEAYVPIDLSIKNTYVCGKCNKENAITVVIETVQTTQPIAASSQEVLTKELPDKK